MVIDVLRAFTAAAVAFHRGAQAIYPVSTPEQAFALRERHPDWLIMGEVDALPVPGFDLPNSPASLQNADLCGRRLIHRSTAGTQGLVRARTAEHVLAAGLSVAAATARRVRALNPVRVDLLATGVRSGGRGGEDIACGDYIADLLAGGKPRSGEIEARVRRSRSAGKFADPGAPEFPAEDLELALQFDRFDFAMQLERHDDLPVLKPVRDCPSGAAGSSDQGS